MHEPHSSRIAHHLRRACSVLAVLSLLFYGLESPPAAAQESCPSGMTRSGCTAATMNEYGCCPIKKSRPAAPKKEPEPTVSPTVCSEGMMVTEDTAGNCCWPEQVWNGSTCVGTPSCPEGKVADATEQCVLADCQGGQVRASDGVHCCWPNQGWSRSKETCIGSPACPSDLVALDGGCASPEGCSSPQTLVDGVHCCWPGQYWSSYCSGTPSCPDDMIATYDSCREPRTCGEGNDDRCESENNAFRTCYREWEKLCREVSDLTYRNRRSTPYGCESETFRGLVYDGVYVDDWITASGEMEENGYGVDIAREECAEEHCEDSAAERIRTGEMYHCDDNWGLDK